jgi:hypothetical protein
MSSRKRLVFHTFLVLPSEYPKILTLRILALRELVTPVIVVDLLVVIKFETMVSFINRWYINDAIAEQVFKRFESTADDVN